MTPVRAWLRHPDFVALVLLVAVTGIGSAIWSAPYLGPGTLQAFGDQAWAQAQALAAIQAGPFGTTEHAGWASGFNPWQYPTGAGLGFLVVAWLTGLLGAGSALALLIVMVTTSIAIAIATYAGLRVASPGPTSRSLVWLIALAFSLSPYVLSKYGHYTVAAFALLPAVLGLIGLLAQRASRRSKVVAVVLVGLVALGSPLWWIVVVLALLGMGVLAAILLWSWRWVMNLVGVILVVGIGSALPLALAIINLVPGGTLNRSVWESGWLGGSLTDFFLASPFVRDLVPRLEILTPATSKEFSWLGFIPAATALFALVLVITAFLGVRHRDSRSSWILVALQLSVLAFIAYGLGTMLEAGLVFLGFESPLRAWSRLGILTALIGALLLAPIASRPFLNADGDTRRRGLLGVILVLGVVIITLDLRSTRLTAPETVAEVAEAQAVGELKSDRCPVAQFPVGTFPDFPLQPSGEEWITYYYRGFVPYLLDPDGYWSFGAAKGTESDRLMRGLPTRITPGEALSLRQAGYCAILFDRSFAAWIGQQTTNWPALEIIALEPRWNDSRFVIYDLR